MTLQFGATTVTLTGRNAPRFPLEIAPDRQQNVGDTENGLLETYDRDVTIWICTFVCGGLSTAQMQAVRNFFNVTVKGSKSAFTLTPDAIIDLGAGAGVAVTATLIGKLPPCRLYAPPATWEQKFTLRWRSLGTGVPT